MKKSLIIGIPAVLVAFYLIGPKPGSVDLDPEIGDIPLSGLSLEEWVNEGERSVERLKYDNQARIIWYDTLRQKTPFAIVYLHGFSASQGEGDPIHQEVAERYGMNLYLSRLSGHGIAGDNI